MIESEHFDEKINEIVI
jgi:hypothetical protein